MQYCHGKGVPKPVSNVGKVVGPALTAKLYDLAAELDKIDDFMIKFDEAKDKGKRGTNAMLGISMACARARARAAAKVCSLQSALIQVVALSNILGRASLQTHPATN